MFTVRYLESSNSTVIIIIIMIIILGGSVRTPPYLDKQGDKTWIDI